MTHLGWPEPIQNVPLWGLLTWTHFLMSDSISMRHKSIIITISMIIELRSSVSSTLDLSRTLSFLLMSQRGVGRPYFLFRGLTIPIWFICFMRRFTFSWSGSPFKWPCMVSFSWFLLDPCGLFLACRNWRLVSFPSLKRFRLSFKQSLMPFQLHFTEVLAPFFVYFNC